MFKSRTFFLFPIILAGLLWALPTTFAAYCGDGAKDVNEECDDGNFVNRDGCDSYCRLEDITPATVVSISIPNGSVNVPTITQNLSIGFSEPIDPDSLNSNSVRLECKTQPIEIGWSLLEDQKTLKISILQDLAGESRHALRLKGIKDKAGNSMKEEFISVFDTGTYIDHAPPTVLPVPEAGFYNFTQNVELKAYRTPYTGSDENLDTEAKIYYTLDGSRPAKSSAVYKTPILIKSAATLKYFAIDKTGNRSETKTAVYKFGCPDFLNAKKVSPYPACNILECSRGFQLLNNVCSSSFGGSTDDIEVNAVTAPLFPSDQPINITSKPALRVTAEHRGVIPRPLIFRDEKRGVIIEFGKNTRIKNREGKMFQGLILPPVNLYMKDFPINFGYSFRSIFEFRSKEGKPLDFSPAIRITLPYTEGFDMSEGVTVLTYNPKNESYTAYSPKLYSWDLDEKQVTITAKNTGIFFVAQKGKNFNQEVFRDTRDHWAKNFIEALYRKGIVKGRDEGVFSPDEAMNRAEFIKIALQAAGIKTADPATIKKAPFKDVPLEAWSLPFIAKAKESGLIHGFKDNTFKPEKKITRAEAIKILISAMNFDMNLKAADKTAGSKTLPGSRHYSDLKKDQWYFPYADFVIRHKLMEGIRTKNNITLNIFGPDKPITRAEMAKLTVKAMELKESLKK